MKVDITKAEDNQVTSNIVRGYKSKDPVDKNMAVKALNAKREKGHKAYMELESYKENPTGVKRKASPKPVKTRRKKGALPRVDR